MEEKKEKLIAYEKIFRALGDKHRIYILDLLMQQEMNAGELLQKVDVVQSTLSHHMKSLCESGLVIARKEKKWTYYTVCPETVDAAREFLKRYLTGEAEKEAEVLEEAGKEAEMPEKTIEETDMSEKTVKEAEEQKKTPEIDTIYAGMKTSKKKKAEKERKGSDKKKESGKKKEKKSADKKNSEKKKKKGAKKETLAEE